MNAPEKAVTEHDSQKIRSLFPATVVVTVAEDWMWQTAVSAQEESLFTGMSVKRQQEFRAGRHCAHAALERAGCQAGWVLRGQKGEPLWPAGFCGTISHSKKVCAAAVASQKDVLAIGLDIEQHQALKPGVLAKIATAGEIVRLKSIKQQTGQKQTTETHYDVLLFSIKEAVYKAYFPLTRQPLGFHDVDVEIDEGENRFVCRVLKDTSHAIKTMNGCFIVTDKIIGAGVTIAAQDATRALVG